MDPQCTGDSTVPQQPGRGGGLDAGAFSRLLVKVKWKKVFANVININCENISVSLSKVLVQPKVIRDQIMHVSRVSSAGLEFIEQSS